MINLLPPEGKKRVLKNYWLRVLSVYFNLLGSAFFVTSALLLPTYFYVSFQIKALGTEMSNEDVESLKKVEASISDANEISELLLDTPDTVNDSDVINQILAFSDGLVSIGTIKIQKKDRKISEVTVSGTANDRSSLVSFRDSAEQHQYFDEVNLPLSNLAKDQDIPFSLTLEPSDLLKKGL